MFVMFVCRYETESANITNGDVLLTTDYLDYLINHDGHTPPVVGLLGLSADSRRSPRWPCPIPWTSDFGADRRVRRVACVLLR